MSLAETNRQIWSAQTGGHRRNAEAARLKGLIRAIDEVVDEVERVNLESGRNVPSRLREQAMELIETVTGARPERVPTRGLTLLDSLYQAQERVLKIRAATLYDDLADDELDSD